ncbi:DNA-binding transcriptional ArsR family regulator [Nocardioides marinisabuli]|uniref:DNA-binding transcriptional ArsR family regulator n=1 Tax=Nocardioides marinisabuli TaxID=419476 RepID=A0A7Y9F2Z7_9ACTN|nr:MarR family transcriptional regulator [Nocardioides marinisabuli]NYD58692.1 DNA-binding transcriptional ArsR family regulator [Nocardioides marinisabuli]
MLALLAVARRTRGRLQPLCEDVTVPQLVLLDAVQICGLEGIGAISTYTLLSQPTVTQQAASLESAGLLRRIPAEDDRRRRVLTLTERGQSGCDGHGSPVVTSGGQHGVGNDVGGRVPRHLVYDFAYARVDPGGVPPGFDDGLPAVFRVVDEAAF